MMDSDGLIWLCVLGAIAWFAWLDDSKIRYKIQYDAEVTVDDKPRDCEFLTAPLGRKNCSYQKEVSIVRYSQDTQEGGPIISYDEGETWQWNPGGPTAGRQVHVYWVRTND